MPRLRFFVTVSLVLGARLDIPQHATAQPSEKKPRDVAKANVLGRQFSVFRHPAYAVVAPAATLRVWIDVENSGGLDDLRFEYTVAGKPAAQQAIRLDRKAANRYQGVVAFDLEPLKLSLKHTLSLTVVTGKLRPRPLQFTLAHPDTVFDNLAKGHKSNRNEVRVLVGRLESLGKTLQTLHNSVAAGNAVKTKHGMHRAGAEIADVKNGLDEIVQTFAFLSQAMKDNQVDESGVDEKARRRVHAPLVAMRKDRLSALAKAFEQLRGGRQPAGQLAAVKQCQALAGDLRTRLAKVDESYLDLLSFHEVVRTLRKIIRQQQPGK